MNISKKAILKFTLNLMPKWALNEIRRDDDKIIKELSEQIAILNESYSQTGEDLILRRIFKQKHEGFFVDVGAHHPTRFSNTYYFYRKGWHGLNIDAMPGSMKPFNILRPKDINVEAPVSGSGEALTYYLFNEPALNTFSKEEAEKKNGLNNFLITGTQTISTYKLADLLEKHLPAGQFIDFMTVDVEGLDYEVLASNDWARFRPKVVLAESYVTELEKLSENPIYKLLTGQGYRCIAKTLNTVFYVLN